MAATVREEWDMACPHCHSDETIDVKALAAVRLTADGEDISSSVTEWDAESPARCAGCGFTGVAADFDTFDREDA